MAKKSIIHNLGVILILIFFMNISAGVVQGNFVDDGCDRWNCICYGGGGVCIGSPVQKAESWCGSCPPGDICCCDWKCYLCTGSSYACSSSTECCGTNKCSNSRCCPDGEQYVGGSCQVVSTCDCSPGDSCCSNGCDWDAAGTDPSDDCSSTCRVCNGGGGCQDAAAGSDPNNDCDTSQCRTGACTGSGSCAAYSDGRRASCNVCHGCYDSDVSCDEAPVGDDPGNGCDTTDCRTGVCDGSGLCSVYSDGRADNCALCYGCFDGDVDCDEALAGTDPGNRCFGGGTCNDPVGCTTDQGTGVCAAGGVCAQAIFNIASYKVCDVTPTAIDATSAALACDGDANTQDCIEGDCSGNARLSECDGSGNCDAAAITYFQPIPRTANAGFSLTAGCGLSGGTPCNSAWQCANAQNTNGAYNNGGYGFETQAYCDGAGSCTRSGTGREPDDFQTACECEQNILQGECNTNGEANCWDSTTADCCGDDAGEDFCAGGYTACYNAAFANNADTNSFVCECGVAGAQGNCDDGEIGCWSGSYCCGDDAGENHWEANGVGTGNCCGAGLLCVDAGNVCRSGSEGDAWSNCYDGIDNDCDSYIDAADLGCALTLLLNPDPTDPSQTITADITQPYSSGTITIRGSGGCGAALVCNFALPIAGCTFIALAAPGSYDYYACIGQNSDLETLTVNSANDHCSNVNSHSDGDETTPSRYRHYYTTDWNNEDCDTLDGSSGCNNDCDVGTEDIYEFCDDYRCQGPSGSAACTAYASVRGALQENCVNTCSDTDGGTIYLSQGTVTDNNLCNAGDSICPSTIDTDSCGAGNVLTEYYCSGNNMASTNIDCDGTYDCTSGISCSGIGTNSISETGDDYICSVGRCTTSGSTTCGGPWACNAASECGATQNCDGSNYRCYYSNPGSYTWSLNYPATETTCNDGHDNDCDGYTDAEDNNCALTLQLSPNPANPSQTITADITQAYASGTVTIKDWLGCAAGSAVSASCTSFSISSTCTFTAPAAAGSYGYYACIGENSDSEVLTVNSPGDHCSDQNSHTAGDEVDPARYMHYFSGGWNVQDCPGDFNENNCGCSVVTTDLREMCTIWECNSGSCSDTFVPWQKDGWTCNAALADSGGTCGTQACIVTTYYCYRTNAGSYTWNTATGGNPDGGEVTETDCTDGYDNDCDGDTDCDDPDCVAEPICIACIPTYWNNCDNTDGCGGTRATGAYNGCDLDSDTSCGTENNCADGIDNDCDGEKDWDDALWSVPVRGPAHGDDDCNVEVMNPVTVSDNNPVENTGIDITCIASPGTPVNSIFAYIDENDDGDYDAGTDSDCGWNEPPDLWLDNTRVRFFNCNVGLAGNKRAACGVYSLPSEPDDRSYQNNNDVTQMLTVQSSACGSFFTQATCPVATCKWIPKCLAPSPEWSGYGGANNGECIPIGNPDPVRICNVPTCLEECSGGDDSACYGMNIDWRCNIPTSRYQWRTASCNLGTCACSFGAVWNDGSCTDSEANCGAECDANPDCNDGNPITTDTCNLATCACEYTNLVVCGDGDQDIGEECDDGLLNDVPCSPPYGGSCNYCNSTGCTNITVTGEYCGDGINNPFFEDCEPSITPCQVGCGGIYCNNTCKWDAAPDEDTFSCIDDEDNDCDCSFDGEDLDCPEGAGSSILSAFRGCDDGGDNDDPTNFRVDANDEKCCDYCTGRHIPSNRIMMFDNTTENSNFFGDLCGVTMNHWEPMLLADTEYCCGNNDDEYYQNSTTNLDAGDDTFNFHVCCDQPNDCCDREGFCQIGAENNLSLCIDDIDNDCDGFKDLADSECFGTLTGYVFDEKGLKLPNVIIKGSPPGIGSAYERSTTTGYDEPYMGWYSMNAFVGTYAFIARKEGYNDNITFINIEQGVTKEVNFTLKNGSCHADCTDNKGNCNPACDGAEFMIPIGVDIYNIDRCNLQPQCYNRPNNFLVRYINQTTGNTHEIKCCEGYSETQPERIYQTLKARVIGNIEDLYDYVMNVKMGEQYVKMHILVWRNTIG